MASSIPWKTFCSLLIASFIWTSTSAQTYSIKPLNTNLLTVSMYSDGYEETSYKIYNITNDTLYLKWELISGTAPANMRIAVCDWKTCLSVVGAWPLGREMEPLPIDTFAPLKLQLNPQGFFGPASGCYKIWDMNNPGQVDTLCFDADILEDVKEDISNQVNIFPNPVNNQVNIESIHGPLKKGQVLLYNQVGKLLITKDIEKRASATISVEDLSPGIYWLRYETEKGIMAKKILKLN